MNRLFNTLRNLVDKPAPAPDRPAKVEALPGFDNRVSVLCNYAERAAAYEDDLTYHYEEIMGQLGDLQELMERCLDNGHDRDALEYLRLAARLRPQRDLLDREIQSFHSVAGELIRRVNTLTEFADEAREFANDADLSPAATYYLDAAMTRLTRYFVLLERVAKNRHHDLPERLTTAISGIVDDRQLDLELAGYILARRRALGSGR